MLDLDQVSLFVSLTPVWPALGAMIVALLLLPQRRLAERVVIRVAQVALGLSFVGALAGGVLHFMSDGAVDYRLGDWYHAADVSFPLVFLFDGLSASVSLLVAGLVLITASFSRQYLHREPGFVRFFLLILPEIL